MPFPSFSRYQEISSLVDNRISCTEGQWTGNEHHEGEGEQGGDDVEESKAEEDLNDFEE